MIAGTSWQQLGLVVLCVANISLGCLVIVRDPRAPTNRLFFCVVLAVVGWVSSISTALSATDLRLTILLGRLGFAFVTPIPFALTCLFRTLQVPPRRPRRRLLLESVCCLVFVLLSLSPWVVVGAGYRAGRPNFLYGPLHPVLAGYLVACLGFALSMLWRLVKASSGVRRLQLQHLGIGIFLGGFGIVTTNLLIPLLWGISYYSVFGPYFTLVFVSFSAHAIVRHRLMEVRVVVRRGAVYVAALAVSSLVFMAAAGVTRSVSGTTTESLSLSAAVAIALLVSILFQPLKHWINDSFNRYLYREPYNYHRTIREATRRLSTILDLQSLLGFLVETVDKTLRVERVVLYVLTDNASEFALSPLGAYHAPGAQQPQGLTAASSLVAFLRRERRPFVLEEPPRHCPPDVAQAVIAELERLGGHVAFPLLDGTSLSGVLVAGPKLSGDPYYFDDLDLVATIVGQAAVGMKNANLYREVVLANERIENVLATMESAVIAVTSQETITMFNAAAERMTGLDADFIKGQPIAGLPAAVAEPISETLRDFQPRLQIETVVTSATSGVTPVIYSTSTMKDGAGGVFGVVGVFSDVSRVRQLEAEKRRTERLASIGALAAGMAHEIKNPLVAIKTFAELLPDRFSDDDFRHEFSRIVMHEVERIDGLVGRLRGLTAVETQQIVGVRLRDVIRETLGLLRAQLEYAKIVTRTSYDDGAAVVAGDRGQLRQLLLNVLINAVEAMSDGGALAIRVDRVDDNGEPWCVVKVEDSGCGIPDAVLETIFDPFVTTKARGSGLGLAICRGIVEAHRGVITASNNVEGQGATVTIRLPADAGLRAEEGEVPADEVAP